MVYDSITYLITCLTKLFINDRTRRWIDILFNRSVITLRLYVGSNYLFSGLHPLYVCLVTTVDLAMMLFYNLQEKA